MKETEISKKLDAILTAYFYYILTKSVFDFKAYARLSEIIIPNHWLQHKNLIMKTWK